MGTYIGVTGEPAVNDMLHKRGPLPMASDMGDCLFTAMEIDHRAIARGQTGLGRLLMGSGVRDALLHAHCSVLLVRQAVRPTSSLARETLPAWPLTPTEVGWAPSGQTGSGGG